MTAVHVVVTDGDRDRAFWWRQRRAHHRHMLYLDHPGGGDAYWPHMCDSILTALGKDDALYTLKRPVEAVAGAWLSLGEITDLVVAEAHALTPALVTDLIEFAGPVVDRIWLLVRTDHRTIDMLTAVRQHTRPIDSSETDLIDRFPDRPATELAPAPVRLPRVDAIAFRRACRQLLDPAACAAVEAELDATISRYTDSVAASTDRHRTRALSRVLLAELRDASTTEQLILRARAAQLAGLLLGFHIRIDTTVLVGAAEALPRPGRAATDRWWDQLDAYRDPDIGAVCAAYTADVPPAALPALRVRDVTVLSGGAVDVHVNGTAVHVAADNGARYLAALKALRSYQQVDEDAPLFATHRAAQVTEGHILRLLAHPRAELRLAVAPPRITRTGHDQLLNRYGITITKLEHTPVKAS